MAFSAVTFLSSCGTQNAEIINLDYGTYRENNISTIEEIEEMGYDELTSRLNKKESFAFAIYTSGCGCWTRDFAPVLVQYINDTHVNISYINALQFQGKNNLGLYLVASDMPSIVIVNKGTISVQSVYYRDDKKIFINLDKFKSFMESHVRLPKMYYISKNILDSWIDEDKEFNLYIAKNSCGDCRRVNTTVLNEWNSKTNEANENLYIFDIQPYNYSSSSPYYWYDESLGITTYQHYKDIYGMSESINTNLGWGDGYVPTFQRRKGSQVLDMITVYNDSYNSDTKTITSYFSSSRLPYLSFLLNSEIENKILDGLHLVYSDFDEQKVQYESKYINPIIDLFLKTYVG